MDVRDGLLYSSILEIVLGNWKRQELSKRSNAADWMDGLSIFVYPRLHSTNQSLGERRAKTSFPTGKTLNFFALLSAASAPTSSAVAIVIFRLTVGSLAGRHTWTAPLTGEMDSQDHMIWFWGTVNVCSNTCGDTSVWTKVVDPLHGL